MENDEILINKSDENVNYIVVKITRPFDNVTYNEHV